MWAYESVFYQIYPLGFCGAPFENDGNLESRILKVIDWIPHIEKLGANAIYFSPVFESIGERPFSINSLLVIPVFSST